MEKFLVTPEELAAHLDDPGWAVFDTRHDLVDPEHGPLVYGAGHIPGAYFLHVDHDLSGAKTGHNGRHPLPDFDEFARKVSACGVGPETQVVAYDDAGGSFAGRLVWLLRFLGHGRAALLDGGLPLWVKQGRPVSKEKPAPRAGSFVPRPRTEEVVDSLFLEKHHAAPEVRLVDARAAERYQGIKEPLDPVAGHIPGALNRFWKHNLRPGDGRFKEADELREEFLDLLDGADPATTVHMCGSGVTACHNYIAMALAGLPTGRLYPGSWSEWCSDPERPVATGS